MSDIFRKKSLENITNPDHLDDYINVSRSSVWMILAAIIVFLLGVGIWCVFGKIGDMSAMTVLFSQA